MMEHLQGLQRRIEKSLLSQWCANQMETSYLKTKDLVGQHALKVCNKLYNKNYSESYSSDIECTYPPPQIPTDSEYTNTEDDGKVTFNSIYYPSLTLNSGILRNSTSKYADIPRNYKAELK